MLVMVISSFSFSCTLTYSTCVVFQKDEDLEHNVNFRTHTSRFIAVVNCAIEALAEKNDEEVTRLFHGMGAQHLQVTGFTRSNFSVFKEALLHCIGKRLGQVRLFPCYVEYTMAQWARLGCFLVTLNTLWHSGPGQVVSLLR